MSNRPAGLVPGTLDLLILKGLSLGEHHGYGVLLRLQQMTGGELLIEQGALYPALHRLERRGLVETRWGTSENNRRAKFYRMTAAGRGRLRRETADWHRVAGIMAQALRLKRGSV